MSCVSTEAFQQIFRWSSFGGLCIYYLLFISRSTTCCHRFYAKYAKKSVMLEGEVVEWKQSRGTHLLSIMKHDFSRFYNIPSELLFDLFAKPQHIFLLLF